MLVYFSCRTFVIQMRKLLYIALIVFCSQTKAQPGKEAWHWYFGSRCTMDFSSGIPIPGIGPSLFFAIETCASISDANTGQYLFSVGYNKVFNKNDVVMYNGANLKTYASQGGLIIPKPGSTSIYYVITNDPVELYNHGVLYSIVDMSLQGGLGAITIKNKMLTSPPTTDKLAGVRHCNGTDYWILTHSYNSNTFNAYLVTSSGIDTIPVVSNIGLIISSFHHNEPVGYLKVSPNGKRLASGINSDSIPVLEIFDFDNSTGIISNPITINYPGLFGPYGLSFSPDNLKLYSAPHSDSTSWLYQYDLSSNIPSVIIASQTLIAHATEYSGNPFTGGEISAMQMASDGKIYIARYHGYNADTLSVINNPNNLGTNCNFQYDGVILVPSTSSQFGLPNFIDANHAGIQINIPDVQQCNTFIATTLNAGAGFTNYYWSTGANTQTITVSSPGKYWVTVTNGQGCTKTDTVNAYLLKPLKSDTLVCDTFHANIIQGGVLQYNWFDNNHNPVRNFTHSGSYYVDINYVSGCSIRDSIKVTIVPSPSVNIGPDTSFCLRNLKLNAGYPHSNYNWSTGETTQSIVVTKVGTYWINLTDTNGCKANDTMIVRPQLNAFDFTMPNIVTPNDDKINDVLDFGIYQFSSLQIEIYNRWGQKVFESNDVHGIWKPTVDDGTYFYTAQYRIDCGNATETKTLKGFITVVR